MTEIDPKGSVQNEQFGNTENNNESSASTEDSKNQQVNADENSVPEKKDSGNSVGKGRKKKATPEGEIESAGAKKEKKKVAVKVPDKKKVTASKKISKKKEVSSEEPADSAEKKKVVKPKKKSVKGNKPGEKEKEVIAEQPIKDQEPIEIEHNTPKYNPEKIDFSKLSKEDLVKVMKDIIDSRSTLEIRKDIESIKTFFYKKHRVEIEEIKNHFLEAGGQIQDFKVEENPLEIEFKELLNKYREFRNEFSKRQDDEKEKNLEKKYSIIDSIKELVNSQESLNRTFQEFRDLQNQWREVGPVPQQNLKDLWESYHYQVEAFYDYIKINKELRDLDLKKNFEAKIKLCEKAEELLIQPSVVEAFRRLQLLHDQWREIGPVPIEKRAEIWERFKEATTQINRKHQEYFVSLKQDQKKNYEEKLVLTEKVEEIASIGLENFKDWEEKSKELIKLQRVWKTIGFAPKKYNTQIYERFRKACDEFFEKKRDFYASNREEQQNNLQLKTELCIQAEGLKDSTDWKKTTDELIALQKKWKEIGPVSAKISDKIWKRFRAACDRFFESKSKYFSTIDSRYEENLTIKLALIEEIEKFELTSDVEKNLNALKDFQRKWSEIGYVPLKNKNEVQDHYRKVINSKFDQLRLDDTRKESLKFRSRVENIIEKPNSQHRLHIERDRCFNKLKQLETDITLWENNIGFFANSKNAESMIADVKSKIDNARQKIVELKAKIRILDELD